MIRKVCNFSVPCVRPHAHRVTPARRSASRGPCAGRGQTAAGATEPQLPYGPRIRHFVSSGVTLERVGPLVLSLRVCAVRIGWRRTNIHSVNPAFAGMTLWVLPPARKGPDGSTTRQGHSRHGILSASPRTARCRRRERVIRGPDAGAAMRQDSGRNDTRRHRRTRRRSQSYRRQPRRAVAGAEPPGRPLRAAHGAGRHRRGRRGRRGRHISRPARRRHRREGRAHLERAGARLRVAKRPVADRPVRRHGHSQRQGGRWRRTRYRSASPRAC